jgi:nicotinamide riboside transporter PnuC
VNYFGLLANLIDAGMLCFGKVGKFLNARGNRYCFVIDVICLSYWFYMNLNRGLYSQGASAIVSIAICIYGWIKWGRRNDRQV